MSNSGNDFQPMTDSQFSEWTEIRSRGEGYFRRKCFVTNSLISGVAIGILVAMIYTGVSPKWVPLIVAVGGIPGALLLPFMLHFLIVPILWVTYEQQYVKTLQLREMAEPPES
ncbi:MAG: hypothetical protein R3C18_20295 [Planctomycetaceae bacterium]